MPCLAPIRNGRPRQGWALRHKVTWQRIEAAAQRMEGAVHETPLLESPALNALTGTHSHCTKSRACGEHRSHWPYCQFL
eukprot:3097562-Amphidinium_carterae.1